MTTNASISLLKVGANKPTGIGSLSTSQYSYTWLCPGVLLVNTPVRGWHIATDNERRLLLNIQKRIPSPDRR